MVKIVLPKKVAYALVGIFVLIVATVGIYAFGGVAPSTLGHTLSEVRPSCSGLVVSSGTDNSWSCIPNPPSCSGSGKILHYAASTNKWYCDDLNL